MENITICNILDRFGCTELGCVVLKNLKKLGCMFISGVYGTQKLRDGRLCGQRLPRCVLIYDLHLNLPLLSLEVALTHLILSSDASFSVYL